jgi:hypothetical protein
MAHGLAVMHSVHRSNLPSSEKSAIQRFYDKLSGRGSALATSIGSKVGMAKHSVTEGMQSLRSGGEAVIVGGALGALDAQLSKSDPSKSGLDYPVSIGSGYNVPLDGGVGVLAFLASMAPQLAKFSGDLQTVGIVGVASWAQRQTKQWVAGASAAPSAPTSAPAGVHGDPILDWAANQS